MAKLLTFQFWNALARIILRNRITILIVIVVATVAFATQWQNMRLSYSEANLLPADHEANLDYDKFLERFGEEGNLILLGMPTAALDNPIRWNAWNKLVDSLATYPEVQIVLGTSRLPYLKKLNGRFVIDSTLNAPVNSQEDLLAAKNKLFDSLPFYKGLVYNQDASVVRAAIYLNKDIVNTPARKKFILDQVQPLIDKYRSKENLEELRISGMPYIRTLNSKNILDEISLFVLAALLVTGGIFFFFFRSWRATIISMVTVIIGVMWALGFLGLFNYEITVLTGLIPPLLIVIGIPNCIFLINKYQQEIKKHGNQAKSLQRVITKVGNATLMTNVTTASGFATFIFTESSLLREFGIVASLSILSIFLLSLMIIPIIYSYLASPKDKHLKHLRKRWIGSFVKWMEYRVRHNRIAVYLITVVVLIASFIGIYQIRVSGSLLEDMPKGAAFYEDILFFQEEFDGILPLEIVVDFKKSGALARANNLKKLDRLEEHIRETPELSAPLSIVGMVKFAKQAFYGGNPKFYDLPTGNERLFMKSFIDKSGGDASMLDSYSDSTGRYARVTTFMKDMGTEDMKMVQNELKRKLATIFPDDEIGLTVTGKAVVFQKGTDYLISNLVISLSLAIILIALFMAWMFKSLRMIAISILPNVLPLLITAGLMGYLGVPIKPSTILVFSIAFGISVDDTIHFLAKYRQELIESNWKIKKSVYAALRETGLSMFYTSIVLFFGFSVFTISSFGGTVALGALVSATLVFAMLANLILLPSLLISLERNIADKRYLKRPALKIIVREKIKRGEQ